MVSSTNGMIGAMKNVIVEERVIDLISIEEKST